MMSAVVVDFDVRPQLVGEAESVGQPQLLDGGRRVGAERRSGGGGSWCASFMRVAILPMPSKRSEGIHDTVLMLRLDSHADVLLDRIAWYGAIVRSDPRNRSRALTGVRGVWLVSRPDRGAHALAALATLWY